jgi:prephenate dehydratase
MRTSIKKRLSIILAVMMLVSLFSFTSAFAATESGSADFSVVIFGNTVYGPVAVDDSQSVLDVVLDQQTPGNYTVDASGSYVYSVTIGGNTYAAQNDSYQYNPDGSGWSYDFG